MEYEDHLTITTPEGLELELLLTGVGSRLIAALLDLIVRALLLGAVVIPLALAGSGVADAIASVWTFVVLFGYDVFFETRAAGRTPGKRWTGLRVISPSGRPLRLSTSAVRNLLRLVDFLPAAYAVGLISILLTQRNQRLGDLAAGTVVVRERRAGAPRAPASSEAGAPARPIPAGTVAEWDVSAISAEEVAAVREFLERRHALEVSARAGLAQQLSRGLRERVAAPGGPLADEQFLEALAMAKAQRE